MGKVEINYELTESVQGRYNLKILGILEIFMPLSMGDGNITSFAMFTFKIDHNNKIRFYP